jgi:hypothetical protein
MPQEKKSIALVYMDDSNNNFFIEDPPDGSPPKWIGRFVNDISEVEHVHVYTLGEFTASWANGDFQPELPFK